MEKNKTTKPSHNVWRKHNHRADQIEIERNNLKNCSKKERNDYLATMIVNIYQDMDSLYCEMEELKEEIKELKKERYED